MTVGANGAARPTGSAATARADGTAPLRDVLALARPQRTLLVGAVLSVLAGALLELTPPLVVRQVVDGNLARGEDAGLLRLA